jgi:signal transduction histidine kinase/CheY-like chemotaxis protein
MGPAASLMRRLLGLAALVLLCCAAAAHAQEAPLELKGAWLQAPADWQYAPDAGLHGSALQPLEGIALTGGHYFHQAEFDLAHADSVVVDFKNTSSIGSFRHWLYDAQGRLLHEAEGGIRSDAPNPFFLSHGRTFDLAAGHYRLVTELDSPFYLAPPQPYVVAQASYQQAIKPGDMLALVCLGIFAGLGLYYAVLGLSRRRLAEGMYALFILGNLLFQGAALLVDSDVLGVHTMALIGAPLLFSNMAYIGFVYALLELRPHTHPRLHRAAVAALALLGLFALMAAFLPNWALELERYGVMVFLSLGLAAGIVRSREGSVTARYYLGAVSVFFLLGATAVFLTDIKAAYAVRIEHVGLVAVTVEVLLLSFLLSDQFARLRRETEAALEEKARSDEANLAKSRFLANMSHEIRTPINAIIGMAQLALWKEGDAKQREQLKKIMQSGDHLLGIIGDILDFSKIDADKLTIEEIEFDLGRVRQDLLNLFELKAAGKGLRLSFTLDQSLPARLVGDPLRLKQVLINLIGNAVKYTEQGEVAIHALLLEANAEAMTVHFEVRDTGPGISAAQKNELFRPFYQGDSSITRKYGGTGLGLAISGRLVRLFKGEIGLVSAPGRGSTFWFTARFGAARLPASAAAPARPDSDSRLHGRRLLEGTHILLAEDHPFNQQVVIGFLDDAGATVGIAANGEEAIDLLRRERFDCVLMDVQMPVLDGLAATRRIRADAALAQVPIIALTAGAQSEDRDACLTAGMNDFISKPFKSEEFYTTLSAWVSRQPRPPRASAALSGS